MHAIASSASTPEDQRVRTTRADFAFEAVMADRLHRPTRKVFGWRHWWLTRTYERLWPLATTWSAIGTLASLPDHSGARDVLPLLLEGLPAYHRTGAAVLTGHGPVAFESAVVPPLGRGDCVRYADNAWLGLALIRHQDLCGDDVSLSLAERLLEFTLTGWSTDENCAPPGGIGSTANVPSAERLTSANGATAALAALVHRLTGDAAALEWALRIYRWTKGALQRDDGLYAHRIGPDGMLAADTLTHDQGVMVGTAVLLADATGDLGFLADARATAAAAANRFGLDELVNNGPARNAVYLRNLFLLGARDRALTWVRDLAAAYDDMLWDTRDRRSGWFPGPGSPLSRLGGLIEIDALLAGAPPHP